MTTRGQRRPVVSTARVALLAAVLVLFAGVAWFVFAGDRLDVSAPSTARPPPLPDRATASPAAAPAAHPDADATAAHEAAAASAKRVEEPPVVPDDRLLIVVRRADDHALLAGAQVSWANAATLATEREWRGGDESHVDENELVEEVGDHGVTDARGLLVVPYERDPHFRQGLVVCARHGSLWGLVNADGRRQRPEARVVTIDLVANDAIRVQIVDAAGRPQPGLVAAFGSRGSDVGRTSRRARTEGPDAIATIRGVAAFARLFSETDRAEWGVTALVPLLEPLFVPVDRKALPKEPVVLKLPPCGRLLFTFVGSDGLSMLRKARVALNAYARVAAGDRSGTRSCLLLQKLVGTNGGLELPFVGCGLEFEVRVEVDGNGVFYEFMNGPDVAGETVERMLKLDFGPVAFVGSILRMDDAPVANRRVTLRVVANRNSTRPLESPCIGEGKTDENGAFSIAVPVAGGGGSFDCELFLHSATGPEHTLNAVAVRGEKSGAARLGTLRVPGE